MTKPRTERVVVTVTAEDIKRGLKGGVGGPYPIERALHRAGFRRARVSRFLWWTGPVVYETGRPLPERAVKFVFEFDNGRAVKPFSFVVARSRAKP